MAVPPLKWTNLFCGILMLAVTASLSWWLWIIFRMTNPLAIGGEGMFLS